MWQHFIVESTREEVTHERFTDFITANPLRGLDTDEKMLRRICAEDKIALDMIDEAVQGKHGGDRKSDNIKPDNVRLDTKYNYGNDRSSALRRLRKDRPDLHAKVLAGKLSPHAAMVKAGFRPKTFTVVLEPKACAETLKRNFTVKQLQVIIACLSAKS
jgi:hypothetical protein